MSTLVTNTLKSITEDALSMKKRTRMSASGRGAHGTYEVVHVLRQNPRDDDTSSLGNTETCDRVDP